MTPMQSAVVGADADLSRAPGWRRAGWSALKFKPDTARSSFVMAEARIGMWLKLASPTGLDQKLTTTDPASRLLFFVKPWFDTL